MKKLMLLILIIPLYLNANCQINSYIVKQTSKSYDLKKWTPLKDNHVFTKISIKSDGVDFTMPDNKYTSVPLSEIEKTNLDNGYSYKMKFGDGMNVSIFFSKINSDYEPVLVIADIEGLVAKDPKLLTFFKMVFHDEAMEKPESKTKETNSKSISAELKETQDWIKEKIELYPSEAYKFKVEFQNHLMIIYSTCHFNSSLYHDVNSRIEIPIDKLMPITFEEKEYNIWLYLKIQNSENLISTYNLADNSLAASTSDKPLLLSKSIKDENLQERLKKAFNHLITLHGGKVIKEKF